MLAYISGAVHRENVALGQEEIHDAENGFLHLTSVFSAANQDQLAGKVHDDEGFRAGAITLRIRQKIGSGNNRKLRLMPFQLFVGGANEQGTDKQIMPGILVDYPDRQ